MLLGKISKETLKSCDSAGDNGILFSLLFSLFNNWNPNTVLAKLLVSRTVSQPKGTRKS
jgi:hypothetical protein